MIINVAYACNDAYMEQTAVSLLSLFESNKHLEKINVFFIDMGTSEESRKDLFEFVQSYKASLTIVPFDSIAYDLKIKSTGRHISSVYAKLFFGRIKDVNRILYLDSDVIIVDKLDDLWNTNLETSYCACVRTIASKKLCNLLGIDEKSDVVNDGVVLMNLKSWREDCVLERCLDFIAKWNGNPPVLSEGTINAVCNGKIAVISPRYNLMSGLVEGSVKKIIGLTKRPFYSQNEMDYARKKPCIIHYLSGFYNRPWCKNCSHPLKGLYLELRSKTKWAKKELNVKNLGLRLRVVGFLYRHLPIQIFSFLRDLVKK